MCGIAGFDLQGQGDEAEAIGARLLAGLAHRGPDGAWFASRGGYGLAQTRLSVVDLSDRVVYPMANEAGDLWLLFNGEIYDHPKLRTELERKRHSFRTRCDSEIVLHGYEEWGIDVFSRIDGMFALALWDERKGELLLTRDQLGVKPLVHTTTGRFAFASETLALVAAGLSDGQPDGEALAGFAAFHYVPTPGTGIRNIEQVDPGAVLIRDRDGNLRQSRWRQQPFTSPPGRRGTVEEVEHALDDSVRRQLIADVPVGVFLSSGIDSSLILDSAVRGGARPVAFTVGFSGHGDFDETRCARRFAEQLGVRHVCRDLELEFHDALDSVRGAYDQPFADASAIATLAVARMAREEVTVGLSGTGGDDLFAGYYRHRAHLLLPLMARIPAPMRKRFVGWKGRDGEERRSAFRLARSYLARLSAAEADDPLRQYLSLVGAPERGALSALISDDPLGERARTARRLGLGEVDHESLLGAIQAFEMRTYLPSDLLTKEDRATMAVGLEGRVPLLGRELLALAEEFDDRQMIALRGGKRVLRKIAARRLPTYLTDRRKRGFAVPLGTLFRGPWREPAAAWLNDSSSCLLDPGGAADALANDQLHPADTWAVCTLIAWEERLASARLAGAAPCRSLHARPAGSG
jgi:asparagine synthase (glutamine-hydrolysing)